MTPKDIRVRIVTVGDASGAQTVAQELRKAGQAAEQAATVTISAAGRATAAIRQQAEAARSTSTSSSGPGITIRSPGNSPAAAAAAVGSTQSGNSGPAQAQTQFAQASREAAQAAQQAAAAVRQSAGAEQQSTTATAASTTATATNTQAKNAATTAARTKAQAIAALAAARTRDTAALGAHTTALIVAARVTQSVTTALSANTIARGANAAAARSGTGAYAAATRAAQAETAAVMANTTAANRNAAARTKAAASGNNITANTQATAANTTAAGSNAAAQGKTVSATEAALAAKIAYTTALAANTTAIAVNSRAAASAVTSIAANITAQNSLKGSLSAVTVAYNTNARASAADTTALAANTRAFAANAAAVNQAAQARRNATNAAGAARAAASAAAAAAANNTNTAANTAALAANTAAMSPNVSARNRATLATARNTAAVAANTAAVASNITLVAGQTAATGTNSASKATNTTRIAAQNAALASNLGLLTSNTAGLNANTGARNRNTSGANAGTKANTQWGLAMMQAAYFVDDLQYGLRGFVNNIPLLLTSFGLSGGLAGIISILAVGIKVCVDHWHLFSGATSEAAKSARKATIELFGTAKAASRAATDAENARAAWRSHTLVIEKAATAYDDLARKIDASTEARRDSDRQALEKEDAQAALDIANIEARQAEGNISDSDAIIQKRDVYRRVAKKKYDIERAALDQEERDALAKSKALEEQRQQMVGNTRNRNATVEAAQKKFGVETFMNAEERKKAEEELKWMEGQLKEREQVVEDTWKAKLIWHRFPGDLGFGAPEFITNPAYTTAVNRANEYDEKVRSARNRLELDKLLQSATGLKGRNEQEDKNLADAAALRGLDQKIEDVRKPLAANPGRRATLDAVYKLSSQEALVKSGTEITKDQDSKNQEREKERVEAEKNAKQETEDTQKRNAALVDDVLDRLRDRANADKQSGAFDRAKARNVTGRGGRRDRLAGIGGQTRDKEQLVGDVIKSAEAIKDGVDGGEVQTLFAALQRLGAALDKRDADYVRFGREMLDLARKLEAQQKNLRK